MTKWHEISKLFAWHIVLPTQKNQLVYFKGFTEDEVEVWLCERGETQTTVEPEANLVVSVEGLNDYMTGARLFHALIPDSQRTDMSSNSRETVEYYLIPKKNPRIAFRATSAKDIERGLSFHLPSRMVFRAALRLSIILAHFGLRRHIRSRKLSISCPAGTIRNLIVYFGTSDSDRKTTCFDIDGGNIEKTGYSAEARVAVLNEYKTLKTLYSTPVSDFIPRARSIVNQQDSLTISQSFHKRDWRIKLPRKSILDFLARLSLIDRSTRSLSSLLENFSTNPLVHYLFDDPKLLKHEIVGHRFHGDFADWNLMISNGKILVFDWERSGEWAPQYTDLIWNTVSRHTHIYRLFIAKDCVIDVISTINNFSANHEVQRREPKIYWILWLLRFGLLCCGDEKWNQLVSATKDHQWNYQRS